MALDLQGLPSLKLNRNSCSSSTGDQDDHDLRYTSLKDIMVNSPPRSGRSKDGSWLLDSSSVVIRNQLVKCAALAYLQSAACILASEKQKQNFFMKLVSSCLPLNRLLAGITADAATKRIPIVTVP